MSKKQPRNTQPAKILFRATKLFRKLFHRHTWRALRTEYRYWDNQNSIRVTVKRCQCRDCGRIAYIHFYGKNIVC